METIEEIDKEIDKEIKRENVQLIMENVIVSEAKANARRSRVSILEPFAKANALAKANISMARESSAYTNINNCDEYTYGSEPSDSDNDVESNEVYHNEEHMDMNLDMNLDMDLGLGHIKYNKLSYNAIKRHINKSYQQDIVRRYSSALDILASYLKGQKIIYMEARAYTVSILNCLMLPSIFISALVAILQAPLKDADNGAIILAALSAFVAFLLAIINYLKLDAEAEAHRISAHKYDKLQSFVEFQSGQVLLFSDPVLNQENAIWQGIGSGQGQGSGQGHEDAKKKKEELRKLRLAAETELIERMRENIKQIEERIDDIKVIDQFIIPTNIRDKYSLIYNTNIFAIIKKIDDYRAKTLTDLKNVKNELRFINAMQKQNIFTYNQRATALFKNKRRIINTILYLNTAFSMIDKMFQQEMDSVKLKQQNCISFYINDMCNRLCCLVGEEGIKKGIKNCCLPTVYTQPKIDILEKILNLHFDADHLDMDMDMDMDSKV